MQSLIEWPTLGSTDDAINILSAFKSIYPNGITVNQAHYLLNAAKDERVIKVLLLFLVHESMLVPKTLPHDPIRDTNTDPIKDTDSDAIRDISIDSLTKMFDLIECFYDQFKKHYVNILFNKSENSVFKNVWLKKLSEKNVLRLLGIKLDLSTLTLDLFPMECRKSELFKDCLKRFVKVMNGLDEREVLSIWNHFETQTTHPYSIIMKQVLAVFGTKDLERLSIITNTMSTQDSYNEFIKRETFDGLWDLAHYVELCFNIEDFSEVCAYIIQRSNYTDAKQFYMEMVSRGFNNSTLSIRNDISVLNEFKKNGMEVMIDFKGVEKKFLLDFVVCTRAKPSQEEIEKFASGGFITLKSQYTDERISSIEGITMI